jgi:hypothetical protein
MLLGDPRQLANQAAYIWTVLQCHRVMLKFILLNFRGHPSVVKEMSLFSIITEWVDPSVMDALMRQVKKAEDAANKAMAAFGKTNEAFAMLKHNYDKLSTEEVKLDEGKQGK